jgi:hypothetical protein
VPVIPAICGSTNRKILAQAALCIKQDPISKITNVKRAGGGASVVLHLSSKGEALSSTSSTVKKRGKKRAGDYLSEVSLGLQPL